MIKASAIDCLLSSVADYQSYFLRTDYFSQIESVILFSYKMRTYNLQEILQRGQTILCLDQRSSVLYRNS